MLSNFERLLGAIEDRSSQIHQFYLRNAAELINLFPVVGPFVRANTIDTLKDKQMQKRLNDLEERCGDLLSAVDYQKMKVASLEVNLSFWGLLTEYHEPLLHALDDSAPENAVFQELILTYLLTPRGLQAGPAASHPRFRLVFLAGASASGKDTLLDLVLDHYIDSGRRRCETLTKFTTRDRRASEAKYYRFFSDHDFDLNIHSGRIIFPYTKRNARYGFDREQLVAGTSRDLLLFAVFTEFLLLPRATAFLRENGIPTLSILIEAPKADLVHRSWNRILANTDVLSRIRSIDADLDFIEGNEEAIGSTFDCRVRNGNDRAIHATRDELIEIIDGI